MADGSIVIDTRLDNSGFDSGSKRMKNAMNSLVNSVNQLGKDATQSISMIAPALQSVTKDAQALNSVMSESDYVQITSQLASAFDDLGRRAAELKAQLAQGFSSSKEADAWNAKLRKLEEDTTALQRKTMELRGTHIKSDAYTELENEATNLQTKLEKLYQKQAMMNDMGVDHSSASWKRLEIEVDNLETRLQDVLADMASLANSGKAFAGGFQTGAYNQLFMGADKVIQEVDSMSGKTASFDGGTVAANEAQVTQQTAAMREEVSRSLGVLQNFGTIMRGVGSAAVGMAKSLARVSFNAIRSGAEAAKRGLSSLLHHTKKTSNATQGLVKAFTGLKRMMITRVKRMFISAIFKSVQESLHNLAKYSSAFNASMSSIKNAATGMGGNVAVAFGNLVNAVAPVLSTLINWLSTAISYLNAFFALLSGKSTVTVAKKQTDDYAKSLKKAGGAAKDLIFGFDELNKPSSGGGGGGSSGGAEFEEKNIGDYLPSAIADLFEKIKAAIIGEQWGQVGELIAEGFNSIVTSVDDWIVNKLQPAVIKWAKNIAEVLNGLVKGIDWTKLGKLFADGLNTIFRGGYTFLSTFDWKQLGTQLANGVNGFIDNMDWVAVGKFFGAKLNVFIDTASSFFKTLDWVKIGESVAESINAWFNEVHWDDLADGLTTGVNGVIDTLEAFILGIDWDGIANTFGTNFNKIIENINWTKLIFTLMLGLVKIANTIFVVIASINWSSLGQQLADGLNKIFSADHGESLIDWNQLATNFSNALKSIIEGLDTFITNVNWHDVGETIGDALSNIDWVGIATKLLGLLWDALWASVELLGGLTEKLVELIFGEKEDFPVPDLFSEDVESQLKAQAGEAGEAIAGELHETILTGIANSSGMIEGALGTMFVGAEDAIETGSQQAQQAIIAAVAMIGMGYQNEMYDWLKNSDVDEEMANLFSQKANDIFGAVTLDTATVDSIKVAFSSAGIEISDEFANAIKGTGAENIAAALALLGAGVDQQTLAALDTANLHAKMTAYMNESGKSLEQVAGELASKSGEAMGKLLPEGMEKGVKKGEKSLKAEVKTIEGVISTTESRSSILKDAGKTGKDVPDKVASTMEEEKGKVTTSTESMKDAVTDPLETLPAEVKPYADQIMIAVTEAIANGDPTAVAAMKTAAKAIVDEAAKILSESAGKTIIDTFMGGMTNGLNAKKDSVISAAKSVASQVTSAMKGILSSDTGYSMGAALAQGLINGVKSKKSPVTDAATSLAQGIINTAKAIFKIGSPSRVFKEIGMFTMEGLEIGIEGEENKLLNTMSRITDSLVNTGTFSVPNIAAGKIIPYSARISDAQSSDNPMAQFTNNFDETMSDQGDILREIRDLLSRMRLVVDSDSLTRAVTVGQRNNERAFGGA